MLNDIISFLNTNAGVSIRYRIRRDIQNENPRNSNMEALHEQILDKRKVRKLLSTQRDDGWFGNEIHGVDGVDSCVLRLLNHGINKNHAIFKRLIYVLLHSRENEPFKRTFPGGMALDSDGRGGNNSVFANVLASLDHESNKYVREEVKSSLAHFRGALNYTSVDDFSKTTKTGSKRFYISNAYFPGSNHIRLLSATTTWRTNENIEMVKNSFANCFALMENATKEIIWYKHKAHYIGPFNWGWHVFPFSVEKMRDDYIALDRWLSLLSGIASIGFVREIPDLATEYEYLKYLLESEEIYRQQTDRSLRLLKWSSTENAWRKEEHIKSDIYFRVISILHLAGYLD